MIAPDIAKTLSLTALCALAACSPMAPAPESDSPTARAEQACLDAVAAETGNPTVTVISSEFSQAGTDVTVGVGPQRAPWRCIAYSDGTTAGIQSLTNEGYL